MQIILPESSRSRTLSSTRLNLTRASLAAFILLILISVIFSMPTWAYFAEPQQGEMVFSFGLWPTATATPAPPPCGSFQLTFTARGYWEIINGQERFGVRGEVCVTNTGTASLQNPLLNHLVYLQHPDQVPQEFSNFLVDLSAHPILQPGETYCYAYDHPFTPCQGMLLLAAVRFRIQNQCALIPVTGQNGPAVHSALNPRPTEAVQMLPFSLPAEPLIIQDATPTPLPAGATLEGDLRVMIGEQPVERFKARTCYTNTSSEIARNLRVVSWLSSRAPGGDFAPLPETRLEHALQSELPAGEQICFEREVPFHPEAERVYRFVSRAEIDNYTDWLPGSLTCPGEDVCPHGLTLEYDFTVQMENTPTPTLSISPTLLPTETPIPTQTAQPTESPQPSSTPLPTEAPPTAVPTPSLPETPQASPTPLESPEAEPTSSQPPDDLPTPCPTQSDPGV